MPMASPSRTISCCQQERQGGRDEQHLADLYQLLELFERQVLKPERNDLR